MTFFAASEAPPRPESMKFPVKLPASREFGIFRDEFAADSPLQRRVACELESSPLPRLARSKRSSCLECGVGLSPAGASCYRCRPAGRSGIGSQDARAAILGQPARPGTARRASADNDAVMGSGLHRSPPRTAGLPMLRRLWGHEREFCS